MTRRAVCRQALQAAPTGRPRRTCSNACRQRLHRLRNAKRQRGYMPAATTVEWATPRCLYDQLNAEQGPFNLDAAATADNALPALLHPRGRRARPAVARRVELNPPYTHRLAQWMAKAYEASQSPGTLREHLLAPADKDSDEEKDK